MDICLNVSTGLTRKCANDRKQQNAADSIKPNVKRLEKQPKNKATSQSVNKRIKQNSLSAIVAKKLKDLKETDTPSLSKNEKRESKGKALSDGENKISKSKSIDTSSTLHRLDSDSPAVLPKKRDSRKHDAAASSVDRKQSFKVSEDSFGKNNGKGSDSFLTFTKVTTANADKPVIARKRNPATVESKKSLSDIFSKRDDEKSSDFILADIELSRLAEETSVRKSDAEVTNFSLKEQKNSVVKNDKKLNFGHKKEKKQKKKLTSTDTKESEHTARKSHGKMSSLFGNNPDIPNIGQRLVKPVDEVVFTATSFSDLEVHPFMVSNLEQNMQIKKLTMVQQKAIPQIFSGKDILIRSQTGSGKTLAYALPIVELLHKIRPKLSRNSGLTALIIVPTRELALQTYECFVKLIKPFTWIVPGYLVGGEKRKAEKARLRKGCNILIATPGRLLDHIKHTSALKLTDVKYFVLDEADRMFDMGYEKDISGIVDALKSAISGNDNSGYNAMEMLRRNVRKDFTEKKITLEEEEEEQSGSKKTYNSDNGSNSESDSGDESKIKVKKRDDYLKSWKKEKDNSIEKETVEEGTIADTRASKRQTILLSATLTQAVEKLAGLTMQNPLFVDAAKENLESTQGSASMSEINEDLIVPQSVTQSYIVTPPKLRMVTLAAYISGKCQGSGQHRILVFMATQDMVDYYAEILSSILTKAQDEDDEDSDPLVDVEFFKLHGSMSQKERTEVFKTFRQAKCSGVLLCTDVAARGLDMPKVDCVVQYTGPLSARDYVHRIGRTARAGSSGTATIFLTPPEVEFVRLLESKRVRIKQEDMDDVLDKLFGPLSKHRSSHAAAVALQNKFESLVLEEKTLREKAYKAYVSWVRFYSSYPREMREIFDRKQLHLGHYAKSFALRDPPKRIGGIGKALREKSNSKPQHKNRLSNEPRTDEVALQKNRQVREIERITPGMLKRVRMLNTSEFDSGLEPTKKAKKS